MNSFEAVTSGFRNYVNFSGRAIRSEFWYWTLFSVVVSVVLGLIDQRLNPGAQFGAFSFVNMIVLLALHDIDRTGWWILLDLTAIGTLVLIYWACLRGTVGANRFGPDPMPA